MKNQDLFQKKSKENVRLCGMKIEGKSKGIVEANSDQGGSNADVLSYSYQGNCLRPKSILYLKSQPSFLLLYASI